MDDGEAESSSVPRNKTYVNFVIFPLYIWNYTPVYGLIKTNKLRSWPLPIERTLTLISISNAVATEKIC